MPLSIGLSRERKDYVQIVHQPSGDVMSVHLKQCGEGKARFDIQGEETVFKVDRMNVNGNATGTYSPNKVTVVARVMKVKNAASGKMLTNLLYRDVLQGTKVYHLTCDNSDDMESGKVYQITGYLVNVDPGIFHIERMTKIKEI